MSFINFKFVFWLKNNNLIAQTMTETMALENKTSEKILELNIWITESLADICQFMKSIDEIPANLTYHFVRIAKIPTVPFYDLRMLCVEGIRRNGATKSILLELVETVSIVLCAKMEKTTCNHIELLIKISPHAKI